VGEIVVYERENGEKFSVGGHVEEEGIVDLERDTGAEATGGEGAKKGVVDAVKDLSGESLNGEVADLIGVGFEDGEIASAEGTGPAGGKFEIALVDGGLDERVLPTDEDGVTTVESIAEPGDVGEMKVAAEGFGGDEEMVKFGGGGAIELAEVDGLGDMAGAGIIGVVRGEAGIEECSGLVVEVAAFPEDGEKSGIAGAKGGHTKFDLGKVNPDEVTVVAGGETVLDGIREGLRSRIGTGHAALYGSASRLPTGSLGAAVGNRIPGRISVADGVLLAPSPVSFRYVGYAFAGVVEKRFYIGRPGFEGFGVVEEEAESGVGVPRLNGKDVFAASAELVGLGGPEKRESGEVAGFEEGFEEVAFGLVGALAAKNEIVGGGLFFEGGEGGAEGGGEGAELGEIESDAVLDEIESDPEKFGATGGAVG